MSDQLRLSMAGSGSWRRWFPDETALELYLRCYQRDAVKLAELSIEERAVAEAWIEPGFAQKHPGGLRALVPVMTPQDMPTLTPWLAEWAGRAAGVVESREDEYRSLAAALSDEHVPEEYVLTILICAHTLDVGMLEELEGGAMGPPPKRADSGAYFLWGRTGAVEEPCGCGYGVNSFGTGHFRPRYIHSSRVERQATSQKSISIPAFDAEAMSRIAITCGATARDLAAAFTTEHQQLTKLFAQTSFATCSHSDALCMVFHMGYGHTAGKLIEHGLLPPLPKVVRDGWGFWVESQ